MNFSETKFEFEDIKGSNDKNETFPPKMKIINLTDVKQRNLKWSKFGLNLTKLTLGKELIKLRNKIERKALTSDFKTMFE